MRITGVEVDGFGVWSDLKIDPLPESALVVYGENEAGKTTLMQFVRSMLYGVSPERRVRYLPPVNGKHAGGTLSVHSPTGSFRVERKFDTDGPSEAKMVADDGRIQTGHLLPTLLFGVDESIFNNVFAVGLREIQELATLDDTDAAQLLYDLSAGLDRVSLVEVVRALDSARKRLISSEGTPSRIATLTEQRDALKSSIKRLQSQTRQYAELYKKLDELRRGVVETEEESGRLEHRIRVIELAHSLGDKWAELGEVNEELKTLGIVEGVPVDALDQITELSTRAKEHQANVDKCRERRGQMRREYHELKLNESLERNAALVEVLADQLPWMEQIERQMNELESEAHDASEKLASRRAALGLREDNSSGSWTGLSRRDIARLRPLARALKQAKADLTNAKKLMSEARDSAEARQEQVDRALAEQEHKNLTSALEQAGEQVSTLRRRIQIDERLKQMAEQRTDLESQASDPVDQELVPGWVLTTCGGVFVFGVTLILAGFFLPAAAGFGWAMSLLGIAGAAAAAGGKYWYERNQVRRSEDNEKQLALVNSQIEQAEQERDELDSRLPTGGGPLAVRLDAAERRFAEIESLVPLDTDRQVADTRRDSASSRARAAAEELKESRKDWRRALQSMGLPSDLTPKQVGRIARESQHMADLAETVEKRQSELEQQRRQFATFAQRIHRIADEANLPSQGRTVSQKLSDLVVAVQTQRDLVGRRQQLRQQARKLKRKQAHYTQSVEDLTRRRSQLLRDCGVKGEDELIRIAADAAKAAELRKQKTSLDQQIDSAISGVCGRQEIEQCLATTDTDRLAVQFDQLAERSAAAAERLKESYQQQGQLSEQLRVMAEDRSLAEKQLELTCVEQQLKDAVHEWQVLGTMHLALESVRRTYERDRQPETLRDASRYLNYLTDGRYVRVWTPLDEDVLRVDDAAGECLPAEVLSRGTREQLFLSLRLALVGLYRRRGIELPLLLDDVFVNFDTRRALAAVNLLAEFARDGHQLLVFTCHEHIAEMFRTAKVEVLTLPDRSQPATELVIEAAEPKVAEEEPVEIIAAEVEEDVVEEELELDEEEAEDDDYEVAEEEDLEEVDEYEEDELEDEYEEDEYEEVDDEDEDEEVLEEEDEWEELDDEDDENVSEAA